MINFRRFRSYISFRHFSQSFAQVRQALGILRPTSVYQLWACVPCTPSGNCREGNQSSQGMLCALRCPVAVGLMVSPKLGPELAHFKIADHLTHSCLLRDSIILDHVGRASRRQESRHRDLSTDHSVCLLDSSHSWLPVVSQRRRHSSSAAAQTHHSSGAYVAHPGADLQLGEPL